MPTVVGALWRPGEAPELMAGQGELGWVWGVAVALA